MSTQHQHDQKHDQRHVVFDFRAECAAWSDNLRIRVTRQWQLYIVFTFPFAVVASASYIGLGLSRLGCAFNNQNTDVERRYDFDDSDYYVRVISQSKCV